MDEQELEKWLESHSCRVSRYDVKTDRYEYLDMIPSSEVEQLIKKRYYDHSN